MPYCKVAREDGVGSAVKIFYRTYGHGPTKALLIIGLAGTLESWVPQIEGLTGTDKPDDEEEDEDDELGIGQCMEVCAFDNRGMGRSSVPKHKSHYTTRIMAKDSISLLDHLGWKRAHIIGHSMGAMIACKLAAMVPQRVLSLALLNVTGGGFECLPKLDMQTLSMAIRFLKARTPEERAAVDLDAHYSKDYLEECIGSTTRREILYQQYVKGISKSGMQFKYGLDGQFNACWLHKITKPEIERIRSAGFLVSVIHGRHDVIAQIYYARKLAQRLYPVARMVELHGGHLVSHERIEEVNKALLDLIKASEMKEKPTDWTNLTTETPGYLSRRITMVRSSTEGESTTSLVSFIVEKLRGCLLNLFVLLVLAFEELSRS